MDVGGSTHNTRQEEAYYRENGPFQISNRVKKSGRCCSLQKVDARNVTTIGRCYPALHINVFLPYLSAGQCAPETCAGSGGPTRRCI